jgi:CRP/FNR family cyclic AMP-dependent transcriptional regulator
MAANFDIAAELRRLELFASVDDDDIATLAAGTRVRNYPRGQVLFNRGDPSEGLVLILAGRIQVVMRSMDGGELILTAAGPGSFLGEASLVDGDVRSADAETLEESTLLLIPHRLVLAVAERDPLVAMRLLAAIASSLRRLTEFAGDLVFLDLPRRVAKLLLTAAGGRNGVVDLGMSQEQLAHRVGGTRQSVNAALRGFERRGWLLTEGRQLTLKDAAGLARYAGTEVSAL